MICAQKRKVFAAVGAGALFIGALLVLRERILVFAGDYLVINDSLEPADVIHVIAGPDYRTDYAIHLYLHGYGRMIFFTGGWCRYHKLYHGQHGTDRARAQGIPLEAIAVDESHVTSTYSEAIRFKEFAVHCQAPIHSVIVVSDPQHMRRARWAYRQVLGPEIRIQMAPVPFESSPYKRRWWTDAQSRAMVGSEYAKILYYYARYQFSWGPVTEWLASLDRK